MGARPPRCSSGSPRPPDLPVAWAVELADGLHEECATGRRLRRRRRRRARRLRRRVGDRAGRPRRAVTPVTRSGAAAGDVVAVAGRLGWSAARDAPCCNEASDRRASWPTRTGGRSRRTRQGVKAAAAGATRDVDVSDGLLADLGHVAEASGVRIELASAPSTWPSRSLAARRRRSGSTRCGWVLTGGEDHALVATFPAGARRPKGVGDRRRRHRGRGRRGGRRALARSRAGTTTSPSLRTCPTTPTSWSSVRPPPASRLPRPCSRGRGGSFEILEATDVVGNAWRHHYDRLHLHTPKSASVLPGLADALGLAALRGARPGGRLPRALPRPPRARAAVRPTGHAPGATRRRRGSRPRRTGEWRAPLGGRGDRRRPPSGPTDLARHGGLPRAGPALQRVPQRRRLEGPPGAGRRVRQLRLRAGHRPRGARRAGAPVGALARERRARGTSSAWCRCCSSASSCSTSRQPWRTRSPTADPDAPSATSARSGSPSCRTARTPRSRATSTSRCSTSGRWTTSGPGASRVHGAIDRFTEDGRGLRRRHRRSPSTPWCSHRLPARPRRLPRRLAAGLRRGRAARWSPAARRRCPGSTSAASSSRPPACCARSASRRAASPVISTAAAAMSLPFPDPRPRRLARRGVPRLPRLLPLGARGEARRAVRGRAAGAAGCHPAGRRSSCSST